MIDDWGNAKDVEGSGRGVIQGTIPEVGWRE
jgi:hypothetical protein